MLPQEGDPDMADSPETQEMGSGVRGKPGTAYDPDALGESGQPGVPTGDQYPTNEAKGDMNDAIVADVHIPGPYPSDQGDPTGEPLSSGPEPTKATRSAGSLGNLTEDTSTSTTREDTGGLGSPIYDEDKQGDK
jgi:hypothetical protein